MSQYLERAAELLEKAAEMNESEYLKYGAAVNEGRLRIATAYAALAAIDKGLLPQQLADDIYGQFATQVR